MRNISLGSIIVAILLSTAALAQPLLYQDNKEYQSAPKNVLEHPAIQDLKKGANNKIQVLEFFSYACSWCYKLDPYISTWEKNLPSDVSFQRIPVEFQPSWQTLSKAYFTIQDLKAFNQVHSALFLAINSEQVTDSSEPILRQFFVEHGVKGEDFDKVFRSPEVENRQKWANVLSQAYRITAVPAMIVQGPTGTYVSTVRMAGGEENLLKVVDFLIQQERIASTVSQNKQ